MQRSALCRSRRELSNAYLLAKIGFDTAENEPCKVCPLSVYRSPRYGPQYASAWEKYARVKHAHELMHDAVSPLRKKILPPRPYLTSKVDIECLLRDLTNVQDIAIPQARRVMAQADAEFQSWAEGESCTKDSFFAADVLKQEAWNCRNAVEKLEASITSQKEILWDRLQKTMNG